MPNFDVAAWMVPLESGIKKKHILKILELLPEDSDLVPFEIHEENSSAYGFATPEVIDEENGLESIIDLLGSVLEDWPNESSECTYALASGKKVYIGCDFRTVIIGAAKEFQGER